MTVLKGLFGHIREKQGRGRGYFAYNHFAMVAKCAKAALLWIALETAFCQNAVPQFTAYPATEAYKGRGAPLVLGRDDRTFRTRLRFAAAQRPNFAGHYILTAWGCGAECLMGALIDANSGHVHWIPFTICCWPFEIDDPIAYRLDSTLVVFSGTRNEKDGDNGTHYYQFKDGKFLLIKSELRKRVVP